MACVHAEPINTPHSILVVMLANVWAVNGTCKCPVEYLNVQFNLANLISHVHRKNDTVLITERMVIYNSQKHDVFHMPPVCRYVSYTSSFNFHPTMTSAGKQMD